MMKRTNNKQQVELKEKLVYVGRCTKVVKGGRKFSFSALVVVGDGKGKVGYGLGKASEVVGAREKAYNEARKKMFKVPLREGRTLHHDITHRFCAGKVLARSAPPGTGIIAGGTVRAVFEVLGIRDVVAKAVGTNNPHNIVRAIIGALKSVQHPKYIAEKRGKTISEILGNRAKKKV